MQRPQFDLDTHRHARARHGVEKLLDLGGAVDEIVVPKLELRVFNQFNESDEQAPRMRSVHDESLQQNSRDLLLDRLGVGFEKQVEQRAAEVVRVAVRIAQLVGDGVKEQVTP